MYKRQPPLNALVSVRPTGGVSADGWRDGRVVRHVTELEGNFAARSFLVEYEGGERRWHRPGAVAVRPRAAAGGEVELLEEWEEVPTRCCISLAPLVDPAKGRGCTHRARCNFDLLRSYVSRARACPLAGCEASLTRSHDIVRDEALKAQLSAVPNDVDVVWVRGGLGGEVRTERPS